MTARTLLASSCSSISSYVSLRELAGMSRVRFIRHRLSQHATQLRRLRREARVPSCNSPASLPIFVTRSGDVTSLRLRTPDPDFRHLLSRTCPLIDLRLGVSGMRLQGVQYLRLIVRSREIIASPSLSTSVSP